MIAAVCSVFAEKFSDLTFVLMFRAFLTRRRQAASDGYAQGNDGLHQLGHQTLWVSEIESPFDKRRVIVRVGRYVTRCESGENCFPAYYVCGVVAAG